MNKLACLLLLAAAYACAAVSTFNYNATGVTFGGVWGDGGGYRQSSCGATAQGYIAFTATGTQAEANIWQGFAWTVSVDGAASTSVSVTSMSAFAYSTLFTGLSDAPHTILLKGAWPMYINSVPAFRVTGASPAVSAFSDFSNPIYLGAAGNLQLGGAPATDTYCGANTRIWANSGVYGQQGGESSFRFSGNPTAIYLWDYHSGTQTWNVYQDTSLIASVTPANNSVLDFDLLASGLSGAHNYEVRNVSMPGFTLSIGLVAANATLTSAPTWPDFFVIGDSIVNGVTSCCTDATQMYTFNLFRQLSAGVRRNGNFGCPVVGASPCYSPTVLANMFAGASPSPKYVIAEAGTNDGADTIGDCVTAGTFTYTYLQSLSAMAAYMATGGTLYLQGVLPNSTWSSGVTASLRSGEQAAVACYNAAKTNSVTAKYVSTDGWIDGTSGSADLVSGSTVHPSVQGYAKIEAAWYPILANDLYKCGSQAGLTGQCNGVQ